MMQPPNFVDSNNLSYVCKLKKAPYGLKQAPWAWYTKPSSLLTSWGFKQSQVDSSMFIFQFSVNMLIILIYVDDILLIGTNSQLIAHLISTVHSQFALKDLGDL